MSWIVNKDPFGGFNHLQFFLPVFFWSSAGYDWLKRCRHRFLKWGMRHHQKVSSHRHYHGHYHMGVQHQLCNRTQVGTYKGDVYNINQPRVIIIHEGASLDWPLIPEDFRGSWHIPLVTWGTWAGPRLQSRRQKSRDWSEKKRCCCSWSSHDDPTEFGEVL